MFKRSILGVILFFVSIVLSAYTAKNPVISQNGFALVSPLLRPFASGSRALFSGTVNFFRNFKENLSTPNERQDLQRQLALLESKNTALIEVEQENQRLKALLEIKESAPVASVVATVIGFNTIGSANTFVVDKGSADGVEMGAAVTHTAGVVGHVISVSSSTAKVLLITDRTSSIDGFTQEERARGIVKGTGKKKCYFEFVNESEPLVAGQRIVTSGLDGIFPKGLVIGTVFSIKEGNDGLFKEVLINPGVNVFKLEEVVILKKSKEPEAGVAHEK